MKPKKASKYKKTQLDKNDPPHSYTASKSGGNSHDSPLIHFNGTVTKYHTNGGKSAEKQYINGRPQGLVSKWYRSGNIYSETTYDKNLRALSKTTWGKDGIITNATDWETEKLSSQINIAQPKQGANAKVIRSNAGCCASI